MAREYTVVPVWREVLADLETPLSAFVKLVGDREGFLLESVEHAERWGRFSFLGRDPARTFVVRGRNVEWLGGDPPEGVPSDQGTLAALDALLRRYRAPTLAELPPFHGGIVGWIGYDTVREIERLPNVPTDDLGLRRRGAARSPVRSRRSTTSASGCYLIENVYPPPGADDDELARLYDDAGEPPGSRRRRDSAARCRTCPRFRRPTSSPSCPELRRNFEFAAWTEAVEAAKEHILDGDIFQVVLAQRFDLVEPVDPFSVYRVLRLVNPSPYMYFLRHRRSDDRRIVARADGAGARRPGDQPADRRDAPARPRRASTTSGSRPSSSSTRRNAPNT